jgi:hypothetical protein
MAPTRLGMSAFEAEHRIGALLYAYASSDTDERNTRPFTALATIRRISDPILEAAEDNGYPRKNVLEQGISTARGKAYLDFFKELNKGAKANEVELERHARILIRLGAVPRQLLTSVANRRAEARIKFTPEERRRVLNSYQAASREEDEAPEAE